MEFLRSFEDDTNQEDQEVNIIGRILNFLESRIRFACGLIDSEEGINQVVSIIICSILHLLKTPMRFAGGVTEHILNLLSHNGSLTFLILKLCFCPWNVAFPIRETVNFVSPVGQLDGRKDLDEYNLASVASRVIDFWRQKQRRPLLDLCMMSAKLVYENELVVKTVVLSKWKMHFEAFYNGWNEVRKEWSTQVFIICDKPVDANLILVSFRGTEPYDALDWIQDFKYNLRPTKKGKLHLGFLESLVSLVFLDPKIGLQREGIDMNEISAFFLVRNKLVSLLKIHPKAEIIITGHSLGGALALMFPTVLALNNPEDELLKKTFGIFTFGQPKIGDRKLAEYMENVLDGKYYRVVYSHDIVPRLPFDFRSLTYTHWGIYLYYNCLIEEPPNENIFLPREVVETYGAGVLDLIGSFVRKYYFGDQYQESWYSTLNRIMGLMYPGFSQHLPTEYLNAVRLGD